MRLKHEELLPSAPWCNEIRKSVKPKVSVGGSSVVGEHVEYVY